MGNTPFRLFSLRGHRLEARVVTLFLALSLVTLTIVATVAYREARKSLGDAIYRQLAATSALKEGEINRWVTEQVEFIAFTAEVAALQAEATPANGYLTRIASEARRAGVDFEEVFFLSAQSGLVIASTAAERIGDDHASEPVFLEGRYVARAQSVDPGSASGKPTQTVAAPVRGPAAATSAIAAAYLDLDRLDQIVRGHNSERPTEAYLVSPTQDDLSAARSGLPEDWADLRSEGMRAAIAGRTGVGMYDDHRGVPVIGAYRWLPERKLVLMVEISQDDAFAPASALLQTIVFWGVAATLILMVGVRFIALSVARPVSAVSEAAAMVAGGDFMVWTPERGPDEVGDLARSFNAMTRKLRDLYADLEGQIQVTTTAVSALEESRALLQSIMDNSTALISVTHPDGRLLVASQPLLSMIGVSIGEIERRPLAPHLPANIRAEWVEVSALAIAKGKVVEREIVWSTQDGPRTYLCAWFPLTDDEGRPFGVGTIATDLTERKRVEAERLRLEAQFHHAQKLDSLGVLAGGIAHDFNNILAVILGHTDLAAETMEEDLGEAREHLGEVVVASQRAAELTNQMLAYAGRTSLRVESLDLNHAIDSMSNLITVSLPKKVSLESDLFPDELRVRADPAQISQVVMNLVTNAAQAIGDQPGSVEISTTVSASGQRRANAVLCVRDSGCGIGADDLERIFEPFYTTKQQGRGLGLAAVTGIVKGLGGMIEVESELGEGATFRVSFPLEAAVAPNGVRDRRAHVGDNAEGTVLVVDDEAAVRAFTRRALERTGFTVLEAEDGLEALEVYHRESSRLDAIVLDLSMPGMGGREVFDVLRRADRNLPVLFTSGYDPADAPGALDGTKAVRFLQKPYRSSELSDELSQLLSVGSDTAPPQP